jgi:NAD(P)-dependent dehydrogenase (short-subunit alcohol dehydrogenase family)
MMCATSWTEPTSHRRTDIVAHPVDTELLSRFAGNDEREAALVARVPLKRAGAVEEIADAIAFLASNKAAFITGQIIDVNGGITAS